MPSKIPPITLESFERFDERTGDAFYSLKQLIDCKRVHIFDTEFHVMIMILCTADKKIIDCFNCSSLEQAIQKINEYFQIK